MLPEEYEDKMEKNVHPVLVSKAKLQILKGTQWTIYCLPLYLANYHVLSEEHADKTEKNVAASQATNFNGNRMQYFYFISQTTKWCLKSTKPKQTDEYSSARS